MKRCVKGKSCSETCISRAKVCRMNLMDNISESLDKLVRFMKEKVTDAVPFLRNRRQAETERMKEARRKSAEEREKERISNLTNTQEFAKKIQPNLPSRLKARGNEEQVSVVGFTKSGNRVSMIVNRSGHVSFDVNNEFRAGTVTDRREQIEVAMAARSAFNAIVSGMKDGAKLITGAYQEDGLGAKREAAYQKMGFSAPDSNGVMAATVKGGKLVPDPKMPKWEKDARLQQLLDYDFSEGKNKEVRVWLTAIFGVSP